MLSVDFVPCLHRQRSAAKLACVCPAANASFFTRVSARRSMATKGLLAQHWHAVALILAIAGALYLRAVTIGRGSSR